MSLVRKLIKPSWDAQNQSVAWPGMSIHANNTPDGTPMWARSYWDHIVQPHPDAPMDKRPVWAMKTGGQRPLTEDYFEEIRERTAKGYRVIHTNKAADVNLFFKELRAMEDRDALPCGVSLMNEPDLGDPPVKDYLNLMQSIGLRQVLDDAHREFGVLVAPPSFASVRNATGDYGRACNEVFGGMQGAFLKFHSYGRVQPKFFVTHNAKAKMQLVTGLGDCLVVAEEIANRFCGQQAKEMKSGVDDEQGADFLRAAMLMGMQTGIATCHFMLYHGPGHNFNDISHHTYGSLRRLAAKRVMEQVRASGYVGNLADLSLDDPRGKEAL